MDDWKLNITNPKEDRAADEQDSAIKIRMINSALILINSSYKTEADPNRLVGNLRTVLESKIIHIIERLNSMEYEATQKAEREVYKKIYLEVLATQRNELIELRKENICHDDEIRKHQEQLDIEETRLKKRFL